jgi:hypothetical protein
MTANDHQNEERPGFLQSLGRILGKMFCCHSKEKDRPTDNEIRRAVGGTSATSTHQKPGKEEE